MKKTELLTILNKIAPLSYQESWDNCGMQIDLGKEDIRKVLVAMEVDNRVIDEAMSVGADMIITHHPLIFAPVRKLRASEVVENYVIRLVKEDMEVYSAHTCFDSAEGGTNEYVLNLLDCIDMEGLWESGADRSSQPCGRIAKLKKAMTLSQLSAKIKDVLGNPGGILLSGEPEKKIERIAICTGAGGEFWEPAYEAGADLFITGELKHHEAVVAKERGIAYIAAGHWGTEWLFVPNMKAQLEGFCGSDLTVLESQICQNPFESVL